MFRISSTVQTVWICGLILALGLVACGKKDKSDDDSSDDQATTVAPSGGGAVTTTGSLALVASPAEALDKLDGALGSAMAVGGDSLKGGSASLALTGGDVACSETGKPISPDAAKNTATDGKSGEKVIPDSDAAYAPGRFYCMIAADTGDSSSIQGAIGEAKMIACLVGDSIVFDGAEHTFDIPVANNPCFDYKQPDGITAATLNVKATANKPAVAGGAGWAFDAHLAIVIGDETIGIDLLGLFEEQHIALTVRGGGTATDAFSFVLDKNEGVRFEGRFQRFEDAGWADHTRLLLVGTLGDDLKFENLERIEGASSSIYGTNNGTGSNGGSTDIRNGQLMTVKGTTADGVRTYAYRCSGNGDACSADDLALWSPVPGTGACYGGACAGNTGLPLAAVADLGFLMRPKSYETVADWYAAMSPLAFTAVTLDETQK